MKKDNLVFLGHMLEAIDSLELFMNNVTKTQFLNNYEKQCAVVRALEILGEAAKNITPDFIEKYPSLPWKNIKGTRDKIIHHYFDVNLEIVWDIINKDLPDLKEKLLSIKKELK